MSNLDDLFEGGEAEFLTIAHDKQMSSQSPEKALYYRMHKEMTPSLVKIINDAMRERDDPQEKVAVVIQAYTTFVASSIGAFISLVADDTNPDAAKQLAEIMLSEIGKDLERGLAKGLAKRGKTIS